jgi:3-mercaptopyruvate sulfurtransferase SseA
MGTLVTETPAASSDVAFQHFQGMLAFETDCWDVHEGLKSPKPDFILVDVRGPASFANGHVQGAINIPHGQMTASRMAEFPKDKLFVSIAPGRTATVPTKPRCASLGLGCR